MTDQHSGGARACYVIGTLLWLYFMGHAFVWALESLGVFVR